MNIQEGEIICIDKPYEITSFGALARVRYLLSRRLGVKRVKIGHAGTLDPLATGVLVLCTGKATKRIAELQAHTKEYVATLQLGATTPSYDMEHPVNETFETGHITREAIDNALQQFVGEIQQVPPTYSAVKVNGDRAYDLRRKGKRRGTGTKDATNRRNRSAELRPKPNATHHPRGLRQGYVHQSLGARCGTSTAKWRISHRLATYKGGRHTRRELLTTRFL